MNFIQKQQINATAEQKKEKITRLQRALKQCHICCEQNEKLQLQCEIIKIYLSNIICPKLPEHEYQ